MKKYNLFELYRGNQIVRILVYIKNGIIQIKERKCDKKLNAKATGNWNLEECRIKRLD